jgi:hypothetical protein
MMLKTGLKSQRLFLLLLLVAIPGMGQSRVDYTSMKIGNHWTYNVKHDNHSVKAFIQFKATFQRQVSIVDSGSRNGGVLIQGAIRDSLLQMTGRDTVFSVSVNFEFLKTKDSVQSVRILNEDGSDFRLETTSLYISGYRPDFSKFLKIMFESHPLDSGKIHSVEYLELGPILVYHETTQQIVPGLSGYKETVELKKTPQKGLLYLSDVVAGNYSWDGLEVYTLIEMNQVPLVPAGIKRPIGAVRGSNRWQGMGMRLPNVLGRNDSRQLGGDLMGPPIPQHSQP